MIDFHAHVFPDRLSVAAGRLGAVERLATARRSARFALRPLARAYHGAQTMVRHLPSPMREAVDALGTLGPMAALLVESTPADLLEAMSEAGVRSAVVIAQEPHMPNEFVLDACSDAGGGRLIPAVNVPPGTARPGKRLKDLAARGARILKIHPAYDGEGVDSPRYRALLKSADELGLPVILHTGCMHSRLLYKDPEQGHAQRYAPWFERWPKLRFVLAHMNFHLPHVALDLAEEHANVFVDTSWQPAETIGEAVRRIGAERVLFATDWPFVGNNLKVGIERVRDAAETHRLSETQVAAIFEGNASRLLEHGASNG